MRLFTSWLVFLFLLTGAWSFTTCAAEAEVRGAKFQAVYLAPKTPTQIPTYNLFRNIKYLEHIANVLNGTIRIPREVLISGMDCGFPNLFYDHEEKIIFVCYELYDAVHKAFLSLSGPFPSREKVEEAERRGLEVIVFGVYHEAAHALFREYHIPIAGKEEDAADQIATLLLTKQGVNGYHAINSAVMYHAYRADQWAKKSKTSELPFEEEHHLDSQRLSDLSCLAYGSAPKILESLVGGSGIPRARADKCPGEYQQVLGAWRALLAPYSVKGW